jgi:hypothetical protein
LPRGRGVLLPEILLAHDEPMVEIGIAGIVAAKPMSPSVDAMKRWLAILEQASPATTAR